MDNEDHTVIVNSLITEHRTALAELRALCVIYRSLLEEAGIEAPQDEHAAEALRRYRALFEYHGFDDPEQHNELTSDWWTNVNA